MENTNEFPTNMEITEGFDGAKIFFVSKKNKTSHREFIGKINNTELSRYLSISNLSLSDSLDSLCLSEETPKDGWINVSNIANPPDAKNDNIIKCFIKMRFGEIIPHNNTLNQIEQDPEMKSGYYLVGDKLYSKKITVYDPGYIYNSYEYTIDKLGSFVVEKIPIYDNFDETKLSDKILETIEEFTRVKGESREICLARISSKLYQLFISPTDKSALTLQEEARISCLLWDNIRKKLC